MGHIHPWRWLLSLSITLFQYKGHVSGEQTRTYDDILASLDHPSRLVFDVSKTAIDPADHDGLERLEGLCLSPTVYYKLECRQSIDQNDTNLLEMNPAYKFLQAKFQSETLTFLLRNSSIFSSPEMSTAPSTAPDPFTVVLTLDQVKRNQNNLTEAFSDFKSRWPNIKLALQYGTDASSTLPNKSILDLAHFSAVILTVPLKPQELVLSYSKFRGDLRRKLNRYNSSIFQVNPNMTIYTRFTFPPGEMDTLLYNKYNFYLLQYSTFMVNDGGHVILPSFDKELSSKQGFDGTPLRQAVIPFLLLHREMEDSVGECEIAAVVNQVSTYFNRLFKTGFIPSLHFRILEINKCVLAGKFPCGSFLNERDVCQGPLERSTLPNIHLSYLLRGSSANNVTRDLLRIKSQVADLPWKLLVVQPSGEEGEGSSTALEEGVRSKSLPEKVTVACGYERMDGASGGISSLQNVQGHCGPVWHHADVVVWEVDVSKVEGSKALLQALLQVDRDRKQFEKKWPDKSIIVSVAVQDFRDWEDDATTLYCRPDLLELNENAEAVVNFARVHNFSVRVKPVLDLHKPVGWWSLVKTVKELSRRKTRYPFFLARNYPDRMLIGGDFPTDPCISWTKEMGQNGVKFDLAHSGTTIHLTDLKNEVVRSSELKTMLTFAFHKFSMVEVVPGTEVKHLQRFLRAISSEQFKANLTQNGTVKHGQMEMFIQVESGSLDLVNTDQFKLKPAGIHLANWETAKLEAGRFQQWQESGIRLGLALEDCLDEVNNRFKKVRNFHLLDKVDYLLCAVKKPAVASNENRFETERYLDTHLYIRKYFRKLFPGNTKTELIFRLAGAPNNGTNETVAKAGENFLRFYSDVREYAKAYQMRFFMFPAFDNVGGSHYGWWHVQNFSSLRKVDSILEKEAEYLGKPTWRPEAEYLEEQEEDEIVPLPIWFWVLVGLGSALLLSGILLLTWWKARRILTEEEIEAILEGRGDGFLEQLKFPPEMEIEKSSVKLESSLGEGHFGLVYRATLSLEGGGSTLVAVKLPQPGSSKECIKSFVSELKVLAYIGHHDHVISFLGAYIKELWRGTAYIVTELYENGALEKHLRKMQDNLPIGAEDEAVSPEKLKMVSYELRRFSYEIALGMEYIAEMNIVHGDLSTRNVLLDSNMRCKIADFGLSRKLYQTQYVRNKEEPVPWQWLAPESLIRREFTTKSDVWAYGVTLWEIFSLGCCPFGGMQCTDEFKTELKEGTLRLSKPKYSSDEIYDMMLICWNCESELRMDFTELAHFFSTVQGNDYIKL